MFHLVCYQQAGRVWSGGKGTENTLALAENVYVVLPTPMSMFTNMYTKGHRDNPYKDFTYKTFPRALIIATLHVNDKPYKFAWFYIPSHVRIIGRKTFKLNASRGSGALFASVIHELRFACS